MTQEESIILRLNRLIDELVARGDNELAALVVPIRDEKTHDYANAGGQHWYGNAQVPA